MSLLFGIVTAIYVLLVSYFLFGINRNPKPKTPLEASAAFSIIVPFRNEEKNLPALLASLSELNYPRNLFEIILVNDASEDTSEILCRKFMEADPSLSMRLLQSHRRSGSPKKDALTIAISSAKKPYVLTTDADCVVPKNWLLAFSTSIIDSGAALISGPVMVHQGKGLLHSFQEMDFLSLQAITAGAFGMGKPILCNGANLCYQKEAFMAVGAFQGNDNIASGDDVFLLEKFAAAGLKTAYLRQRDAIVTTAAQSSLGALFSQRIRWAAKTSAYTSMFPKAVGAAVFAMNILLVVGLVLYLLGSLPRNVLLISFLFKFNVDFVLIYRASEFFGRERSMKNYFWASAVYPFFCGMIGVVSLFTDFSWKGRKFRK